MFGKRFPIAATITAHLAYIQKEASLPNQVHLPQSDWPVVLSNIRFGDGEYLMARSGDAYLGAYC